MRRRLVSYLIASTVALTASGCRDSIAPSRSNEKPYVKAVAPVVMFGGGRLVSIEANSNPQGVETIPFVLSPEGGRVKIGNLTLNYAANAVCDPATSGYGEGTWLNPCETLTESIQMTARFWVQDGQTYAEFSPDIRFAPDKMVRLATGAAEIKGATLTDSLMAEYQVLYMKSLGTNRYLIDDSWNDSNLATVFGLIDGKATGNISRRIYHFSGYYVRSGEPCDDTIGDPECM
jgi:hypothetical protein